MAGTTAEHFGFIGLGTMGRNLVLNITDHGFKISAFDIDPDKRAMLERTSEPKKAAIFSSLAETINSLPVPRIIILLVPAGMIVDGVIGQLIPLLSTGDLVIDGGNSHFKDTATRYTLLAEKGIHFIGMGVSGGEEGARNGPCLMPGGDIGQYQRVQHFLESIAAKVNGNPCVSYIGKGAAGHFVKMVHNGIEYALMQLIADTYEVFRRGCGLSNDSIRERFQLWNSDRCRSYLLSITIGILAYKTPKGDYLLDMIRDEAKAKGTGKWTTQIAAELELPAPSVAMAVAMRDLSKHKTLREMIGAAFDEKSSPGPAAVETLLGAAESAFYFSMVLIYAQGLHLLQRASEAYDYELNFAEVSRIWQGGCIIRADLLQLIAEAFKKEPALPHLLLDTAVAEAVRGTAAAARSFVSTAIRQGLSVPCYVDSIAYFDAIRNENMPTNLIQAQRDYFGAHTYELKGKEGAWHTEWIM